MPSTGNKATAAFKTMDIKSALSTGSRKRKAPSPQVCKSDAKNVKLSFDSDNEKDVEILDEVTVTLDQSAFLISPGDCKENKDINASNTIHEAPLSPELKENKDLIAGKDIPSTISNTPITAKLTCPLSPKATQNNTDMDLDQSLSDKSKISDNSSCDELNTSIMNSSVNVSLNTSGQSLTGDDCDENINSKKIDDVGEKSGENIEKNQVKARSKKRKMTPSEAKQKAEEREQKQKERLLKKQELENKKKEKLIEKERRILERQMREQERKEKERIKQEKKEQEEKERLLKQKEKEEKLQQKLEEKKKKEDERKKREEEQKKAEEEKLRLKLEKEQKEREKKERAKAAFVKFFVRGDSVASNPPEKVSEKEGAFLPFQVSDDMILAPVVPPAAQERFDRKQLDHCLEHQDVKELYLQILKSGLYKDVRLRKRERKLAASEADVIAVEENAQAELGLSAKLLQFCENVRPPYWGTWRKKSKSIRPRNPFGEDEIFDYSVDSDDEWDEGGPGESLSGTEPEDESEDDYEVDNEFFVPHGYLSDEEEKKEEEEDDDEEVNDPEKQRALLKIKLQEFEMERKKKTTELKPIILGCYFTNIPSFQDAGLQKFLQTFSAELLSASPIPTYLSVKKDQSTSGLNTTESPKSSNAGTKKKKSNPVPEEAIPQLIRLVHGNIRNRNIMAEEFQKFWLEQYGDSSEAKQEVVNQPTNLETEPSKDTVSESTGDSGQISLRQLRIAINRIATYGKPPEPTINKCCWWVRDDVREKYGLMDVPFPNKWNYTVKFEEKKPAKSPSVKGLLS